MFDFSLPQCALDNPFFCSIIKNRLKISKRIQSIWVVSNRNVYIFFILKNLNDRIIYFSMFSFLNNSFDEIKVSLDNLLLWGNEVIEDISIFYFEMLVKEEKVNVKVKIPSNRNIEISKFHNIINILNRIKSKYE